MSYDPNNIFAKMLRGEIPNKTIFDNEFVLAFEDIAPQAPIHILVIPKGAYTDISDFSANASPQEITGFWTSLQDIVAAKDLARDGYRVICNTGPHSGQEVPHFHAHIIAGRPLGPLVTPA